MHKLAPLREESVQPRTRFLQSLELELGQADWQPPNAKAGKQTDAVPLLVDYTAIWSVIWVMNHGDVLLQ